MPDPNGFDCPACGRCDVPIKHITKLTSTELALKRTCKTCAYEWSAVFDFGNIAHDQGNSPTDHRKKQ